MGAGFLISYPTDGGLHGWENKVEKISINWENLLASDSAIYGLLCQGQQQ